ncbi:Alpha/Beta hydrolase protein [Macrophomina phaseolina]|uniref:Alpha/Beta hydrolase protein n=1 Tax=Macrophomina phaseolina TaxID=35725 RepID=A0ABQ8GP22_9PEZI|nr:Alpha/Beta hydrolase protein [Macrophomina phaseolina]
MLPINIVKGSLRLAGLLYKPEHINGTLPGVVVVHPAGGGYVASAFDAAHQGDSEGLPHSLEDPNVRVSDVSAVVDYLERLDYVDSERIAVLGICAGGGYATAAATDDHRLKAVGMVSAVNFGDENPPRLAQGAEPTYTTYVPATLDDSTPYDVREAHEY